MVETAPYIEAFEGVADGLPGGAELRRAAIARFAETGFPGRKDEDWRYTKLGALAAEPFAPADAPATELPALAADAEYRLVFVDGRFDADRSALPDLGEGSYLLSLAQGLTDYGQFLEGHFAKAETETGLAALNTAMMADGVIFHLGHAAGTVPVLHIVHLASGTANRAAHTRNLIVLEDGTEATVIEHYVGADGEYWTNGVTQITLKPGARLTHHILQDDGAAATHTLRRNVRVEAGARYAGLALVTGATTARNEVRLSLAGEGASVQVDTIQLGLTGQSLDSFAVVEHAAPDCESGQNVRNVLAAKATASFQGRIVVNEGAQRTDAEQSAKSLLLDRSAEANTKPELIINADDVKCAHGATVGELDQAALFYLEARGIPADQARAMLAEAFAADTLDGVTDEKLRAYMARRVAEWMALAVRGATA